MSATLHGTLEYLTWSTPWAIINGGGTDDLAPSFWRVAASLRGKPTKMDMGLDAFSIRADASSEFVVDYDDVGAGIILTKERGFSNVLGYAEMAFHRLNGRQVIATIDDDSFSVIADPSAAPVPTVKYFGDGNMGRVPDPMPCQVGTPDCCIFAMGGASGFECGKFSSVAGIVLHRKAEGTMRATRIGNCRLTGREGGQ